MLGSVVFRQRGGVALARMGGRTGSQALVPTRGNMQGKSVKEMWGILSEMA